MPTELVWDNLNSTRYLTFYSVRLTNNKSHDGLRVLSFEIIWPELVIQYSLDHGALKELMNSEWIESGFISCFDARFKLPSSFRRQLVTNGKNGLLDHRAWLPSCFIFTHIQEHDFVCYFACKKITIEELKWLQTAWVRLKLTVYKASVVLRWYVFGLKVMFFFKVILNGVKHTLN